MHPLLPTLRPALLSLALVAALVPAAAAELQAQGPADPELLLDNGKKLFSPDDEGGIGAGGKESSFRKQLGPATLRFDLKLVAGWNGDPRGKGNDDAVVDLSNDGMKGIDDDAQNGWMPTVDVVAGGALDVDLGIDFEAFSVEAKKHLLKPKPTPAGWKSYDLTVKVAGFTVRCGGEENASGALGKDLPAGKEALTNGSLLKRGIRMQFWAGCVPIIVRGNAGLSLGFGLAPKVDLERSAFGAEIEPNAYAHAWLSAGIGGAVGPFSISAGVLGKFKLVDTTLQLEGGLCLQPRATPYVGLRVALQPIQFEAQLFAQVQAGFLSRTFTWTLFGFKAGKQEHREGVTPWDADWAPIVDSTAPVTEAPGGRPGEPGESGEREPQREGGRDPQRSEPSGARRAS